MLRKTLTALLACVVAAPALAASLFPDVPDDHPHSAGITQAARQRLFQGYPDGLFKPDQDITHPQLVKVILRAYPKGLTRAEAATFLTGGDAALTTTTIGTAPATSPPTTRTRPTSAPATSRQQEPAPPPNRPAPPPPPPAPVATAPPPRTTTTTTTTLPPATTTTLPPATTTTTTTTTTLPPTTAAPFLDCARAEGLARAESSEGILGYSTSRDREKDRFNIPGHLYAPVEHLTAFTIITEPIPNPGETIQFSCSATATLGIILKRPEQDGGTWQQVLPAGQRLTIIIQVRGRYHFQGATLTGPAPTTTTTSTSTTTTAPTTTQVAAPEIDLSGITWEVQHPSPGDLGAVSFHLVISNPTARHLFFNIQFPSHSVTYYSAPPGGESRTLWTMAAAETTRRLKVWAVVCPGATTTGCSTNELPRTQVFDALVSKPAAEAP